MIKTILENNIQGLPSSDVFWREELRRCLRLRGLSLSPVVRITGRVPWRFSFIKMWFLFSLSDADRNWATGLAGPPEPAGAAGGEILNRCCTVHSDMPERFLLTSLLS